MRLYMQPVSMPLPLRAALALIAAIIVTGVVPVVGAGGETLRLAMRDWAPIAVYGLATAIVIARAVRVRNARGPWTVLALGMVSYVSGHLVWSLYMKNLLAPPFPSVCDVLWLALYPASYVGLVLLAGGRARRVAGGVWLDGLIAGLGVATVGAALVFPPILDAAAGSTAAVVTNLAYPVFDLLLVALVGAIASVYSWRLSRTWWFLGGGFLALAVGDTVLLQAVAAGSIEASGVANVFFMSGIALIAVAAWQPPKEETLPRIHSWSILIVPATCTGLSVFVLVYDHVARLGDVAVLLAATTILLALARTALTFRDVRGLAETRRQATTDDLTSLPNRRFFMRRADQAITASLESEQPVAMLIVDLDHFKELNDTLGHHAGDTLLSGIGPRLLACLEPADTLARLGGDEFGLMLEPGDEARAVMIAERVLAALEAPFAISGLELSVSASVGIALCPLHGLDTTELMQCADIAMYEAKASRSRYQVFEGAPEKYSREHLALVGSLPDAIGGGQLELHYQPMVQTETRRLVGAEALVRWRHPVQGLIAPHLFIPMFDRAGLGRQLTRWVLDTALAECRRWHDGYSPLRVAINVTTPDLLDSGFPAEVAAALDLHSLPAEALIIEITETAVLNDPARADTILRALRRLGVGVALDDFGTGYSSLTHLRALPVTEVKIDRSFVSQMCSDTADAAIVGATIGLARGLGLSVTAEGVEDEETWRCLAELGCDLLQGFHCSEPLPGPTFATFLRAQPAGVAELVR